MTTLRRVWTERIALGISCFLCYCILMFEIRNRSRLSNVNNNIYQKWLNKISLIIVFGCIFSPLQLLLDTIPTLCSFVSIKYCNIDIIVHILITYYQIIRLDYCFNNKYSKILFILLYINGILFFVYVSIFNYLAINLSFKYDENDSNHIIECRETNHARYTPYLYPIIPGIWYFVWDLIVLIIYVFSIQKLKQHITINNIHNNQKIIKKCQMMTMLLKKVLILTVLIQIIAIALIVLSSFENYYLIALSIKSPIVCILIHLLLQHNHTQYIWIVRKVTKCKCCCCCKSILYQTIPNNDSIINNNIIDNNNNNNNINDMIQMSTLYLADDPTDNQILSKSNNVQ